MTKIVILVIAALLALGVTGCKTGLQSACDGHGSQQGYANGWVKCSDGTWQAG